VPSLNVIISISDLSYRLRVHLSSRYTTQPDPLKSKKWPQAQVAMFATFHKMFSSRLILLWMDPVVSIMALATSVSGIINRAISKSRNVLHASLPGVSVFMTRLLGLSRILQQRVVR
jgi:hypothetical protein